MSDTPLEATLIVKVHEQMARIFESVTTITTSGQEESEVGFDTTTSIVKPVYLQYKRPYELKSQDRIKFGISDPQRKALVDFADNFDQPSVFYVFPLVIEHERLPETLSRTIFVDAQEVTPESRYIYIPRKFARNGRILKEHRDENLDVWIDGRRASTESEKVSHEKVWAWETFKNQLERCSFGTPVEAEIYANGDRRRVTVERPPAGASVSAFESRSFLSQRSESK